MNSANAVRLLACTLVSAAGVLSAGAAAAADLTVTIQPTTISIPQSVSVEVDNSSDNLSPFPTTGYVYTGTLAPPPQEWVIHGLVVGRWSTKSQPIKLRITQMTSGRLSMPLFNYDYSADKGTLDFIDDGKDDLSSCLTRYFVARDVFARIQMAHEVKYRAFRLWYDAAYNLAAKKRFFGIDEDVINKGASLELEAKSDGQLANLLMKSNRSLRYFTENNRQFRWTFYREISTVQSLAAAGHFEAAQLVNAYYLEQYNFLTVDEQAEIKAVHGVTLDTLKKNADFLRSLVPAQHATPTSFPAPR